MSEFENTNLVLEELKEESGKTLTYTDENTYTGIIPLSDIQSGKKDNIKLTIKWNDVENSSADDAAIASTYDAALNIPISIVFTQYLGENIEEYVVSESNTISNSAIDENVVE